MIDEQAASADLSCGVTAALDEQLDRWRGGERPGVEELLRRFPSLRHDDEAVLDLIYREVLLRREAGETPTPDEYGERFPGLREAVVRQFLADGAMATNATLRPSGEAPGLSATLPFAGTTSSRLFGKRPPEIEGYEILGLLGRGGMGVVYQARHRTLQRVCALKMILAAEHASAESVERFLVEARAVAQLDHPNIVRIYAVGEEQGRPFVELELAEGGSLDQQLDTTPWEPRRATEMVEPLARALAKAHAHGIVHRDLKPGNILLDGAGVPKLADFGLAKSMANDSGLTATSAILGTPSYMAPEQAAGRNAEVGPATDIHALGAILYVLLTGRPPFHGASVTETLEQVKSHEPVAPRRLVPGLPRDIETIALKCLQKKPDQRYPTAAELADDLRRFLGGEPIQARPAAPVERLVRWCRRNPWPAAFLGLLVLALAASASLAAWALAAQRQARIEANSAQAVSDFLTDDLLARAGGRGTPEPDLKVRTALDRAALRIGRAFAGQPLVEASLRHTIGKAYSSLGLYPEAATHLERAVDLLVRRRGEGHARTLEAMSDLGELYYAMDRSSDGETIARRALAAARRALGPNALETLWAEHYLAMIHVRQGRFDLAKPVLRRVTSEMRRRYGDTNPKTLDAMETLGELAWRQQKHAEAVETYRTVVALRRRVQGDDHLATLQALSSLAETLPGIQQYDAAEKTQTEVIEKARKFLGESHPLVFHTMSNLGEVYYIHAHVLAKEAQAARGQGQTRHAEELEARAKTLEERSLATMERALEGFVRVLGPDHDATLVAKNNLGQIYVFRHEFAKAEPLISSLLDARRRTFDRTKPATVQALMLALDDMGALRVMQRVADPTRSLESAEPLLAESIEVRRILLGETHPDVASARMNLAKTLMLRNELERAKTLLVQARDGRQRTPGSEEVIDATVLRLLGDVQLRRGHPADAEVSLRRDVAIQERLAPSAPETFEAQSALGESLAKQKKFDAAEHWLTGAHAGLTRLVKDAASPDPQLAGLLHATAVRLADLYEAWGKLELAKSWRQK